MTEPFERPLNVNSHLSKKQIVLNNFYGGIAWGLGSAIGASVVFAVIGYILKALGVFTAIGSFFGQSNGFN